MSKRKFRCDKGDRSNHSEEIIAEFTNVLTIIAESTENEYIEFLGILEETCMECKTIISKRNSRY